MKTLLYLGLAAGGYYLYKQDKDKKAAAPAVAPDPILGGDPASQLENYVAVGACCSNCVTGLPCSS